MIYIRFFLVVFLASSMGMQAQLNDYKYIVVPKKFNAFKNENQHQTSTLIKYLFVNKGYNAVYEDDYPDDLKENPCLGLKVDLIDDSSLFRTKTSLALKNCQSKEIFRTNEGSSKIKDFKEAYNDAIRKAFRSFNLVNYQYQPKDIEVKTDETVTLNFKNDVKSLDEDKKKEPEMVEQKATQEEQSYKSMEPVESEVKKADPMATKSKMDLLYAQPIENGYQLVDATPKVKYRILNTSADGVYLVEGDGLANGLMFKKEGKWMLEGTKTDGAQIKKELRIKF